MNNNSDKKIWNDFRNGESYALSHIYYHSVQLLFRYGKKLSQNDELIKDSIQDLFFDLLKTRKSLGQTDNIKYYLITSFRRKLIKNLKKQGFSTEFQPEKLTETEIVYSAEQLLISKENLSQREELVQQALKKLSNKQREIIFYRFTCNFEYEQICKILKGMFARF